MRKFAALLVLLIWVSYPGLAIAFNPTSTIQATTALTVTIPALETGELYDSLLAVAEPVINPVHNKVTEYFTNYVLLHNPVTMANNAISEVSILWQFMTYFSNLTPGLTSMMALITFFFVVILVKTIASVLMYIWKLIPLKAS